MYIEGRLGWDSIWSSQYNDSIVGEYLVAYEGNDLLTLTNDEFPGGYSAYAGEGNDTISGTASNDYIWCDDETPPKPGGNDTATGGDALDMIMGWLGDDTLKGQGGNDYLYGDEGYDVIEGGAGADRIWGGWDDGSADPLTNLLYGNAYGDPNPSLDGNDTIYGGQVTDYIWGHLGNDSIEGREGNDTIYAGGGNDTARGGADQDEIWGGTGDSDSLYGDSGNDVLHGGVGSTDYCSGGSGTDACWISWEPCEITAPFPDCNTTP